MAKRLLFVAGLVVLGLELVALALGVREAQGLVRTALTTRSELHAARQALAGSSPAGGMAVAQGDIAAAAGHARTLQAAAKRLQPLLAPALRSAPARREFQQGMAALRAADDGGALGAGLVAALDPLLTPATDAGSDRQQLLVQLQQRQPALAEALLMTSDLDREVTLLHGGRLARTFQPELTAAQQDLPLAESALRLAIAAPALLGASGPQSYLVVAQDPADLRPTGGFLGSWGVMTVSGGKITALQYKAYGEWENVRDPQRAWPLQTPPVQRYFGFCCMDMQDANWYPDFPTTAQVLERFAEADQPAPLAGVVAFDPALVQVLLRATGPVDLPAYGLHVTADNLVSLANYFEGRGATQPPPTMQLGKKFLVLVAQALAERLSHNPHLDLPALAQALLPLLDDKHVLIALNDAEAAAAIGALGWDGAVQSPPGDYLLLDEMSMSDNKIDASISRSVDDQVQLTADGGADVTLRLRIANQFPSPVDIGAKTTDFRDFFRLYLPPGTALQAVDGADDVWPPGAESGHVVASGFMVIPLQQARTLTVRYHVPAAVIAGAGGTGYALRVQVQPGIPPLQLHLRVSTGGRVLTDTTATLERDRSWWLPVAAAAATPVAPPAWDRTCVADALVAGLKGPFSSARFSVPAACTTDEKRS